MKRSCLVSLALSAALAFPCVASAVSAESTAVARAASARGVAWLAAHQAADGSFSNPAFPALTGLPLWALSLAGDTNQAARAEAAVKFILGCAQEDGGIYRPDPRRGGAGLGNYNTSVCMMALQATGRKDVVPAILKARTYTASTQLQGDDDHAGGFGYDKGGRRHTDLSNTSMALDAMRMTQGVEEMRPAGEKRADLNWDAALKYVSNMQEKDGGFLYVKSAPAGAGGRGDAGDAARPRLRSYGSITYDGLLSLIHCQLTRSDPRVVSALDYCTRHWTLDENPGQGGQGLYFYYDILSRALNAAGVAEIAAVDGRKIAWKDELIKKLASLQKEDGSWVNDNNRWWEADPVLATSYSLIALCSALGK